MRAALVVAAALAASAVPRAAGAFCGFYVEGSGARLFADATQVVLMREGTRTVLAMQNDYKGPPDAFAMVIPVPVVLREGDVKTLPKEVFDRVEQMSAPRLVEYWEQDPCAKYGLGEGKSMNSAADGMPMVATEGPTGRLGVTVEAQFAVGEYKIVILSARDSTGLDTWLRQERYRVPDGAEPLLRPYVEAGMKWFVAKVDPAKVKFDDQQRAALSPLRFHYDSDEFALPIRLGLANSSGKQDLIVNILAPGQRYELANYKNATIPTNIDVTPAVKGKFGEFYAALFDRTVETHPGAVITEYAWAADSCDPCPGPALDPGDFATLGADVLIGPRDKPVAYDRGGFVLTRLHARYGKADMKDDLRFRVAQPIVGGREHVIASGKLEEGARPDSYNNFQARYAIRYPWTGPITCADPVRNRWGGPDGGLRPAPPQPAGELAYVKRDAVQLPMVVAEDVPELGIKANVAIAAPVGFGGGTGSAAPAQPPPAPRDMSKRTGCGCAAGDAGGGWAAGAGVLAVALALVRRRRPGRRARASGPGAAGSETSQP